MTIIASFDDGCKLDLKVAELLSKYNLRGIFYIPSYWYNYNLYEGREPLAIGDVQELAKEFEIGSHTQTHPMLTRITGHEAYNEIYHSKFQLQEITGQEIDKFAYPKGYAHENHKDMVRKLYTYGRNVEVGYLEANEDSAWQSNTVHVAGVKRKEYKDLNWFDEAIRYLKLANQRDSSIYSFFGHSWEIDKFNQWSQFETFLKAVSSI